MLKDLRDDLGLEIEKSGKSERYYKLKDEEFLILYRLEGTGEFKYA
jgi:DNA-binding transcriptional ArsR family regulator